MELIILRATMLKPSGAPDIGADQLRKESRKILNSVKREKSRKAGKDITQMRTFLKENPES